MIKIHQKSRHLLAVLGLVLTTLIWGGSFVVMKATLQIGLGLGAMLALRFTLAAGILGLLLLGFRIPIRRRAVLDGLWLGLVLTVVYWLNGDGLRFTTATKSGFITGLYVLFTPLASLAFRDRLKLAHGLGALAAVVGLALLVHQPGAPLGGWNRGDSETLGCAAANGLLIVLIAFFSRRSNGFVLAFVQISVMMALSWILTGVLPANLTANGTRLGGMQGTLALLGQPGIWVSLAYQGILATGLAFLLMCTCQAWLGATEAAIVYCLEAVFTALLAASGWIPGVRDVLGPLQIAGGALVVAAMLLVELGPKWMPARRAAWVPPLDVPVQ